MSSWTTSRGGVSFRASLSSRFEADWHTASFTDTGVLGTNIAGRIIEDRDLSAPSLWYDRWNYPLLDHIYLQRALENYPRDIGPGFSNEAGEIVLSDPDATLCAQMYESVESATPPSPPSIYDQKTATSKNPLWTTYGLLNRKFTFGEDVEEPRDNKVKPPISIDGLIHISNFNGRMRSKSSHSSSSCISAASTSDSAIDMNYTPRSSISLPENNATNSGSDKARTGCRLKPLYGKSHSGSLERNFARPKSPLINQPITVDHLSCGYMPKYATQPKCTEEASAEDKSVLGPLEKHGYQIESIFYMESPPPYLEEKVVSPNQGPKSPYLPMDICTPSDTSREDLEVDRKSVV